MRMDYERVDSAGAGKRSLLSIVLLPPIAFVAVVAAMGWLLVNGDAAASFLGVRPAAPPAPIEAVRTPVTQVAVPSATGEPERLLIDPEITRRVNRLEQRIAAIDTQSRAAVGNADRAEGLLVAFAARRALDRGVALGYIEGLLRQRFGDSQRQAVATIIPASRQPVTLEELQEGLQEVGEDPKEGGPDQNWWGALKAERGGLVTVSKGGTPSTLPAERLRRATRRLESGQVEIGRAHV